jgi:predicted NBD/HSP70 family sugar kinase
VDALRAEGPMTRAQLCALTGLCRATVSGLVGELFARGLLVEQPAASTRANGRPVSELSLNRASGVGIGIDIGVRHIAVAVGDSARNVYAERWWPRPVGHTSADGFDTLISSVQEALREARAEHDRLIGAAVGLAAPIDARDGSIAAPDLLPGWAGEPLVRRLARTLDVPVRLENVATLGALGEYVWGPATGVANLIYVKLASRVGAGLILNGSLFRGATGFAGELGHITVNRNGLLCRCGARGCLELYAGGAAMLRKLGRRPDAVDGFDRLVTEAMSGDAAVLAVVQRAARFLGQGLAAVAKLLDPQRIVIGGELWRLGEVMAPALRHELGRYSFASHPDIEASPLGRRASLLGALALALTPSTQLTAFDGRAAPDRLTRPSVPPSDRRASEWRMPRPR